MTSTAAKHADGKGLTGVSLTARALRWSGAVVLLGAIVPVVTVIDSHRILHHYELLSYLADWKGPAFLLGALAGIAALGWMLRRWIPACEEPLTRLAEWQARSIDDCDPRKIRLAIFLTAFSSLLLELAIIRWQAAVWPVFAFYKNFSLLACFAGLGLGYALSGRKEIPLFLTLPLFGFQVLLLSLLRNGLPTWAILSLSATPIREQVNMGYRTASEPSELVVIYAFLGLVFLATALAFLPVGQLCGRWMEREAPLAAYGLNLAGSLAGIAALFALSHFWAPPSAWFAPAVAVLVAYSVPHGRSAAVIGGIGIALIALLGWPGSRLVQEIHSPYQSLERTSSDDGFLLIRAAGHYYQRVHDLSLATQAARPELSAIAAYYELPYRLLGAREKVAVVGAGTGNDVAAALRSGSSRVDAIEIDPAIQALGAEAHPERPYADARVHTVIDDARSFLRTTDERYDLIVYGLLDSHSLLSQASSVRLDSFVYTVEGLRDARSRLADAGVVSLSFSIVSPALARKIYLMMAEAFDGTPPVCIRSLYDGATTFLAGKRQALEIPSARLADIGFKDVTSELANSALAVDLSTDDWPFFYMPRRVYPASYIGMGALVLLLSFGLLHSFQTAEKGAPHRAAFFLLGAGFMLVETKAVTELGLTFGNTWQIVGIVIAGILVCAYLANSFAGRLQKLGPGLPLAFLLALLAAGWWIAGHGGLSPTPAGRLATVALLTGPVFFSGLCFSTLLRDSARISTAMGANLLGAMAGGLIEYNSMYFGFRFLYLMAFAIYLLALVAVLVTGRMRPQLSLPG